MNILKKPTNIFANVRPERSRILLVSLVFALSFCILVIRLFDLVIFHDSNSSDFPNLMSKKEFTRADLIDRNGLLLATNLRTASLYADCRKISEPEIVAKNLSKILPNLSHKELLEKLKSGKSFVWIQRNLTPNQQYAVNNLGVPGLNFEFEEKRIYPHGNLCSHVLGFVDVDGSGLGGIEKFLNKQLAENEEKIQLSIDVRVQNIMRTELLKTIKNHEAEGAVGILMNAKNGEVLAMTSLPDFDPHRPSEITDNEKFNKAVQGVYEMGSSFKPFTMAMAIEAKVADLNDVYYVGEPIRAGGKFTISDFHRGEKWLSVPEIFLYSSNIGMAKINLELGNELQREYLQNFGFLEGLPIELNEKATPIFPKTKNWGDLSIMTISYGYGIAVTPMHLVQAFASLVNGGDMPKSSLLKTKEDAELVKRKVISQQSSDKMRKLLRLVVKKGTGRKVGAEAYKIGGKTGTANKSHNGSYNKTSRFTTFLSSFPMANPEYVMLIMLDNPKPQKGQYGFATAAYNAVPASGEIVKKIAPFLSITGSSPEILLDEELIFEHQGTKGDSL